MTVEVKYTYEDLLTSPDDRHRYEIFDGGLIMTPAPNRAHQKAHSNLFRLLSQFVVGHDLGDLYSAPFDVHFDQETVLQPDILFISKDRLHIVDEQKVNGAPDVVVEITSPSTEKQDRGFKFKRYAEEGVREYWIVDPRKKSVEVYRLSERGFLLEKAFGGNDEVVSPFFEGLKFPVPELWK